MSQLSDTTGLVARIESLKRWQLEQQEKLLAQQSQQSAFLSNEHKRMYQALGLEPFVEQENLLNLTPESNQSSPGKYLVYNDSESECVEDDAKTKHGNSTDQLSNNPDNLDDKPIDSACKDFAELLETKLRNERTNFPITDNNTKPKKTFLKRGSGLSRYRMSINDLACSKPKLNKKFPLNKVNSIVKTGARKTNKVCTNELNKNRVLPKKEVYTSESNKNYVSQKKVVENRTKERNGKETNYSKHQNVIDNCTEVQTGESVLNTTEQKCIRPLDTVEYEDKFEINLLAKDAATYNTPGTETTWKTTETPLNPIVPDYQTLLAELIEVRRRDPSLFDTPVINDSADNSQRIFEREMLDELKIFELLEQKASNSSFCSTSSLVMRLMEHSVKSTPKRTIPMNSRQFDKSNSEINKQYSPELKENSVKSTPKRALVFSSRQPEETVYEEDAQQLESSDNESMLLDSSSSSVNSDDISDRVGVQKSRSASDKPRQLQNAKRTLHSQAQKRDATTNTETSSVNPELLKTRLEQLENEIATFRSQNARVASLKSDLETDQRSFEKRKRQLEKEIDEQKRQMNTILEAEKAKLAKDKLVYDKYARELKEGKSARKKERDEISVLRSQISTIEEEFRMKESRWGATQARLRNQLRQLEKENVALKTENNELRTKNGKLEASHKQLVTRRPTDTKVLHEINKNLTKLAQEAKSKTPPLIEDKDTNKRKSRSKTRTVVTKRVSVLSEPEHDKENDSNSLNINDEVSKSSLEHSFQLVEKEYERMFGKLSLDNDKREEMVLPAAEASSCSNTSGQREESVLEDGSVQTAYSNGNVRLVSADGQFIVMRYHNGDVKETCHNTGTVRYLYADACTWHTTFPDGMELLEFSNGQTEKRFANGASEIYFPNGCKRCTSPGGTEEVTFPDGTLLVTRAVDGEKVLTLPNGQREVHTPDHKRREYPDGTVKLIYPDGVQETRYANGRIRLKDKHGNLIMDSAGV